VCNPSGPYPKINGISSRYIAQLTADSRYTFTTGRPLFLSKVLPFVGIWAPMAHPSLHRDRFSRFYRAHDRDRQTDRLRYSVYNSRPPLCSTAMRPKNDTHVRGEGIVG